MKLTIAAILITMTARAEVPMGKTVTVDTMTICIVPYPVWPPGIDLPGVPPPELRSFGLIISIQAADQNVSRYILTATVKTASGQDLTLTSGVEVHAPNPPYAALSHSGDDRIVTVLTLSVATVTAERTFQ